MQKEYYASYEVSAFPTLIHGYNRQNEKYMTPVYYETEDGVKEEQPQKSYERGGVRVEFFADCVRGSGAFL